MAVFGISGTKRRGLSALFATHPDLDDRIESLDSSVYPDYK
jgi:Zn-dependent protease with chaperone function